MGSLPRGISASRGASVLGLGQYEGQTVFTAWQQICEERRPGFNAERGYISPPPVDNAAVRWGSAFEDAIVELASAKQRRPIGSREFFVAYDGKATWPGFIKPEEAYITCHIDGWYEGDEPLLSRPLHEGKTTSLFAFWESWGTPGTDRIPQGYQVQVQHQMFCTGAGEAIVSVLVFPRRVDEWEAEGWEIVHDEKDEVKDGWPPEHLRRWWLKNEKLQDMGYPWLWATYLKQMGLFYQYPVAASSTLQRTLVEAYSDFWNRYVLPEKEPDINAYDDLKRAFPSPVGTIVVSEQEERWLSEYKAITEEISDSGRMGKRREELKVITLKSIRERIKRDSVIDEESQEKVIFRNAQGKKVGQYNGKVFRV